ncbi:tetratricopeptide repeat protein [Desulfoluna sp.]|uniref:tetratricopeptide repeat protein n=1 Tax=Desulfoluna sp. TaxID=2045199 RepID=UPI0026209BCA|nr:tetratricopeptide repeat protein [Desulfoluna sp.]
MGLFSLFSKSPEDLEKKGDALVLSENYGPARTEYAKALEKLVGKEAGQGAVLARIEEKYAGCGESLARVHLENAVDLHESGIDAEAHHLLHLAGQLATDGETKKAIEELVGQLSSSMAGEGEEWDDDEEDADDAPSESYTDADQSFEALCMSLPEAQGEAYMDYGDAFRNGYSALNSGAFAEAESALDEALQANGESSYVPLELGSACFNLGKTEKAETLFRTFLAHHPAHAHGVELLCHLYLEEGHQEKALTLLDENVGAMTEPAVELVLLKGRLLNDLGQGEAAETWLADHLENQWDDNVAFFLASLKKEKGDAPASRKLLETSMGHCTGCGKRPPSHIQLTYANLLKEEGDTSVGLIERYLKLAMEDPSTGPYAYQAVSEIYRTRGDNAEADRYAAMAS